MDTDNPAPAPTDGGTAPAAPAEPANPTPQPGSGDGGGNTPPEPTDPAPQMPDPDVPDHGVDSDKGIDPDKGDEPTGNPPEDPSNEPDPDNPADKVENENQTVDLSKMSRAERVQYFQELEAKTTKEVEARVNATYKPTPLEELKQKYIDEGKTDFEASMLAREEVRDQELDIARASSERAELNAKLAIESTEVLADMPWLNAKDKEAFDKEAAPAAIEAYDRLCLTRDDNTAQHDDNGKPIPGTGQIIGALMTPKEFFGLMDKIRSSGNATAELKAQKAAEEQMAAVAAPSSNSNKREAEFDSLSNEEKRARLRASGHLVT